MSFPLQSLYNWYRQTITNPKYRWWIIAGTLVYLLSPFDLAPDFIPMIGQIDDALLVTILATELSQVLLDRTKTSRTRTQATTHDAATPDTVDVQAVASK